MAADPRFNAFFMLTGATFIAFASGFGVCLFDLSTVNECLAVSSSWVDTFRSMGDHIIQWAVAIGKGAFRT